MTRGAPAWVARASSRSRTFLMLSPCPALAKFKEEIVSARRRNQHAGRVRSSIQFAPR